MKGDEIRRRIIDYLSSQPWPSTTGMVAEAAGISWNTAELNLLRLQVSGEVLFSRVGRQNHWWLNRKYKEKVGRQAAKEV